MCPSPIGACRSRRSPARELGVVGVHEADPLGEPVVRELVEERGDPFGGVQPVAGREQVTGVEAEADGGRPPAPEQGSRPRPPWTRRRPACRPSAPRAPGCARRRRGQRIGRRDRSAHGPRSGSPPPPAPACTTSASAPRRVAGLDRGDRERRGTSRGRPGFGEAMFTRYGACAISGPSPLAAHASRNASARSSVDRGGAQARGFETKTCAQSAPRRRHSRTTPRPGFRSAAHVRARTSQQEELDRVAVATRSRRAPGSA